MEDVSDAVFRRLCRSVGAELCVTEFVNVEELLVGARSALRKMELAPEDAPTGIQIYGSDPGRLMEAARIAERANPAFIDINCGCWIPKIAARGAGAGWLREPAKMVAMASEVVRAVDFPVTVKTRIGYGPESEMPIVDLARRLEDVGVRALTVHCRTAKMRHDGKADWTWAAKAQAVVKIPVVVNGDVKSAEDAVRALRETGCAGVMVGRGAMENPWLFREARALLEARAPVPRPSSLERLAFTRRNAIENVQNRREPNGVQTLRRHLRGYFEGVPGGDTLRERMYRCDSLAGTLVLLDEAVDALTGSKGFLPREAMTRDNRSSAPGLETSS